MPDSETIQFRPAPLPLLGDTSPSSTSNFQRADTPKMPSICNFDVSVLAMKHPSPIPLAEYDVRLSNPSTHAPSSLPITLSKTEEPIGQTKLTLNPPPFKPPTSTCQCYIPSTPNQQF